MSVSQVILASNSTVRMLSQAEDEGGKALMVASSESGVIVMEAPIREKAQEKVFSELGRLRALKRERPDLIIGVGGCVASQEGAAIVKRAPHVDMVFGPQTLHRLPQMIRARRSSGMTINARRSQRRQPRLRPSSPARASTPPVSKNGALPLRSRCPYSRTCCSG